MYSPLSGTVKEAPPEGVTLSNYYMPPGTSLFVRAGVLVWLWGVAVSIEDVVIVEAHDVQ